MQSGSTRFRPFSRPFENRLPVEPVFSSRPVCFSCSDPVWYSVEEVAAEVVVVVEEQI